MASKTKIAKPVVKTAEEELIESFGWVVNATDKDIKDTYWFGESDFDPTSVRDNAASNFIFRWMKITGLNWDEAKSDLFNRI